MTEQEAKEYMENEIRCIQRAPYCDRDCAKCSLVKEEEPLLEAFKEAIKALEKQIPKKPAYQGEHEKCPTCGSFCIDVYCAKCGQKINYKEQMRV